MSRPGTCLTVASHHPADLFAVVPARFRTAIALGAGEGMRLGEVLGFEDSPRCLDPEESPGRVDSRPVRGRQQVHVVQQLRFHRVEYGGFYLAPPKSCSVSDVDLENFVAATLADHVRDF